MSACDACDQGWARDARGYHHEPPPPDLRKDEEWRGMQMLCLNWNGSKLPSHSLGRGDRKPPHQQKRG